jgi:hypothetical protein
MPVIRSGPGYNGITGAKATYDPASDMWIDTNGERIRTDAIVPGEAPAKPQAQPAGAPAATTAAAAGAAGGDAAGGGGGGIAGAAMGGLRSAMTPTPQEPTMTSMGTPAAGNPNLGNRSLPINALKLALRQSQFGRVY